MNATLNQILAGVELWPAEPRRVFTEMAEASREALVTRGDWSFVNEFCARYGVRTGGCDNRCTQETNFMMLMNPVLEHFRNIRIQEEDTEKRKMYMEMLRSGRKDEFVEHMQRHIRERDPDMGITQEIWQKFHSEERGRQEAERQRVLLATAKENAQLRRVEEEAKRRIAQEEFEAAVQAKIRELKGLR